MVAALHLAAWVAYQGAELEERLELVPAVVLPAARVLEHGACCFLITEVADAQLSIPSRISLVPPI